MVTPWATFNSAECRSSIRSSSRAFWRTSRVGRASAISRRISRLTARTSKTPLGEIGMGLTHGLPRCSYLHHYIVSNSGFTLIQ